MELKEVLNDKQAEAASYLDSHLRIIAGAGSGKTRVLTYRIAYLIQNIGIPAHKILAITFTNKAANEMKERVNSICHDASASTLLCTIHSLCVRILRHDIQVLGYPTNFVIFDEEDQKALIKKIQKELEIDTKSISVKSCIHYISVMKCNRINYKKAAAMASDYIDDKKAKIYKEYELYKEKRFMLDFDDLLLKTLEIFENYADVLYYWQSKYNYIHVDEFQDVGEIDYSIIRYLSSGDNTTLCVVGDPDQTIYSFRGSDINYIMNFDKDFKNVKTIILDQNYRSTKTILDISNNLIRKNRNRLEKDLFTENIETNNVIHYTATSEVDEANFVCDKIEEIINNVEGVNYSDFAILYRANYLSRPFEQRLIQRNIDYKIFGGLKFFNRKEVKDALSYLRLLVFQDDLSFERIINVPARGIGAKTLESIRLKSLETSLTEYEALSLYSNEIKLSSKTKSSLTTMYTAINKAKSSNKPLEEMFDDLMNDLGYIEMLRNDNDENRIQNILELKNSIHTYCIDHPDSANLESYLTDIALYTSTDDMSKEEYVSLMSIHMAKGLEFNYVFVVGLSQDIFPNARSLNEGGDEGIEEERRLAYVAFTRAKKQLFLTDSNGFNFINNEPKSSSQFIKEIGKDHVEHLGVSNETHHKESFNISQIRIDELRGNNGYDSFSNGELIMHDVFGKGVVIKVHDQFIDVAFEMPHGIKTLLSTHKSIHKLSN